MASHPLAGKPALKEILENIPRLVASYYTDEARGPVSFGTSGHRGSSIKGTFNDTHIAATSQSICEYRIKTGITGPLFLGFDTHALSEPAFRTALEVFAANQVEVVIHERDEYTPTPVISFLILDHNSRHINSRADGVVVTPSHNPPPDGGFKYNLSNGGPADVDVTGWIQERANELMDNRNRHVKRISYQKARKADTTHVQDFISPYVNALSGVLDMDTIKNSVVKIGIDPMGGSGVHYWTHIIEKYGLNAEIINPHVDPTFSFMYVDSDGLIRMDCSSSYAMAGLIAMADRFDIAWGNDPDFDRHGIVCPDGLMNPNHYLSVAIWYLMQNRSNWKTDMAVGKTLVSSSMIDKVVADLGKNLFEVPVGFKWFVKGMLDGTVGFGGEESAGASFLRKDGTAWSTDKDGFIMSLLSAEILARSGKAPSEIYHKTLVPLYGNPYYRRADGPITHEQKEILSRLSPDSIKADTLASLSIKSIMTTAPGNNAPIGGVKVMLEGGSWFAIRPSGTEPKMKVYVESFGGEDLWQRIYDEALPLIFGSAA